MRRVRLLNAPPSHREQGVQGLRVLTGTPVQPFQRRLTRERVAPETAEYLMGDGMGQIPGTAIDLDFMPTEWEDELSRSRRR